MPLRYRIMSASETVQDLRLAAEDRFWEGTQLLLAGRAAGGVYLLGYVAEMLLKGAYFHTRGVPLVAPVRPLLGMAKQTATLLPACPDYENGHSPLFWVFMLRHERRRRGRLWPAQVEAPLMQRMHRLHGIWCVAMRYRHLAPDQREASSVYNDVAWLRDRWLLLWR